MLNVPFLRPNPPRLSELQEQLIELEESGVFTNYGPVNGRFEQALADRTFGEPGSVVTTCNATIALMMAIRSVVRRAGRRQGRYALMPSFTFVAAAQAAEWAGLSPLLCDIDPMNWMASADAENRLIEQYGDEIAVIVPYATFGGCLDLARYTRLSRKTGIPIVVDAAASLGSLDSEGRAFGSGFDYPVVFSMHATKAFSAGEGGIIHCGDRSLIDSLRQMGNFGFDAPRSAAQLGLNSKLSEIGALLGLARLEGYDPVLAHREELAAQYRRMLPDWIGQASTGVRQAHTFMPVILPSGLSGYRDQIISEMKDAGIGVGAYFSPHVAEHPYLAGNVVQDGLTVTNWLAKQIIALPIWDAMTLDSVDLVCATLRRICNGIEADQRSATTGVDAGMHLDAMPF